MTNTRFPWICQTDQLMTIGRDPTMLPVLMFFVQIRPWLIRSMPDDFHRTKRTGVARWMMFCQLDQVIRREPWRLSFFHPAMVQAGLRVHIVIFQIHSKSRLLTKFEIGEGH